ncbi:MAG TPA: PH domain-containing protein [Thermoleophilaceae bacterium]|nr:PH domain-containing protein [Thermoleophilaceae bacterium]
MELRSGEQQLYEGRPSWRALMSFYAGGFVIAALVLVIFGALAGSWVLAVILAAVIAGLTLVVGYLRRISTKYLITTQRLRISRGVIRRSVQETRLDRVQNVNYEQGLFDRIFHVGSVDFDTAGTDDSEFRFEWVNGPETVVRAVDEAIHQASATRSPTPGSSPPLA